MSAIRQLEIDNLSEFGELDIIEDDKRSVDPGHGLVGDPWLGIVVPGDGQGLVYQPLPHRDCGGHGVWKKGCLLSKLFSLCIKLGGKVSRTRSNFPRLQINIHERSRKLEFFPRKGVFLVACGEHGTGSQLIFGGDLKSRDPARRCEQKRPRVCALVPSSP